MNVTLTSMALHALIAKRSLRGTQELDRLARLYPEFKEVIENVWLIRSNQTSKQISEALFPRTESGTRTHMVLRVSAWWGWNDPEVWEWMSASKERE